MRIKDMITQDEPNWLLQQILFTTSTEYVYR